MNLNTVESTIIANRLHMVDSVGIPIQDVAIYRPGRHLMQSRVASPSSFLYHFCRSSCLCTVVNPGTTRD